MSKMDPIGDHIESCEPCQLARYHQRPLAEQIIRENSGAQQRAAAPCEDCKVDQAGIMFYVNDQLWEQISRKQIPCILCIRCSEKRIGRRFTLDDLLEGEPINAPWRYAIERYGQR